MATTVGFSGVGSGIDFSVIRDAILSQRSVPITQLQSKANTFNSRIDALKQFNTALTSLTTAAKDLTSRDLGTGKSTSVSDGSILSSSASSQASFGVYDINITRLATNLTQASKSFSSTSAAILPDGETSATFQLRKGGSSNATATITIDSSNNSLSGLMTAINNANVGITASIVDVNGDGTGNQLILNSKETGANGRVELFETTSTATLTNLNIRSINPPDSDFTKLNAAFTVNGLSLVRSNNSISDAVSGVTLNLKKVGTSSLNVTQSGDVENKLRGFVTAYNAVQDFIAGQYKADAKGRPTGTLAGDTTLRTAQKQLSESLRTISDDNGGSFTSLSEIGISVSNDGKLSFDSTTFNDKYKNQPEDVRALLFGKTSSQKGIFNKFYDITSAMSDSVTGSVQNAISGYQTSVKSINDSVSNKLEQINRLRDSLTKKFSVADAAIGQLNGQGSALTNIMKSLQSSSN